MSYITMSVECNEDCLKKLSKSQLTALAQSQRDETKKSRHRLSENVIGPVDVVTDQQYLKDLFPTVVFDTLYGAFYKGMSGNVFCTHSLVQEQFRCSWIHRLQVFFQDGGKFLNRLQATQGTELVLKTLHNFLVISTSFISYTKVLFVYFIYQSISFY